LPALFPYEDRAETLLSNAKVRHCPVLSFDSRCAAFKMGTDESKDFTASDFCSEERLRLTRARDTPDGGKARGRIAANRAFFL
jgi:hypothetical protein